jgi:hypothetical protein
MSAHRSRGTVYDARDFGSRGFESTVNIRRAGDRYTTRRAVRDPQEAIACGFTG